MSNEIVAKVNGRDVTRAELSAAFNLVANKDNWKLPIDAKVILSADQVGLVFEACIFFAGCVPTFEGLGSVFYWRGQLVAEHRVKAVGYYSAVGA